MKSGDAPAPVTRRRGQSLVRAIHLAALCELADTSLEELSFDKIAARAGTGKAVLYRRWRTPAELVLEALTDPGAGFGAPLEPNTGSLRNDLVEVLREYARALDEPRGRALRPLMTQRPRHPELYAEVYRLIVQPRLQAMLGILRAAAERGEAAPEAVTERVASVGTGMIILKHMTLGPIPDAEIEALVDEILLPLATAPR
ncbi:TetR/AcrR family transcriptional regulator [Actinospica sp.]|uniref:TetR/AcrR family transcriptional regulator n=1 Tax=Actinospica sp. TaxID=1872142 RepID=UPI002BB901E6|nr:TetR/AcrR family transcriptional regulator [Actinospica sp.]HWG24268.1 TetR/AcrR family transcriptional regulator [Actinospica sp.]